MSRKNQESQLIEWKQNWQDNYLEWICGFANASGGILIIGKADNGDTIGVEQPEKLLEKIPNKIRQQLGLVCSVNSIIDGDKTLIEIITPQYSVPVSYRGHYYYRSGTTKTELTGQSLNEFLLKGAGKSWDDIIEPTTSLSDIDPSAIQQFKQDAERAGRLPDLATLNTEQLLLKLRLIENGQLKRAAIVLFGRDPDRFYRNLFVKIGRFGQDVVELRYQEESEGNLIYLLHDILEQLQRKFLIKPISFEGVQRLETLEYPIEALRELLLNALVHRNYTGAMTQIRVHDDRLCIWNSGNLPEELSIADLTQMHASFPRNPLIAQVCYKAGYIDNWGRGIDKVIEACKKQHLPKPDFKRLTGGLLVTLNKQLSLQTTGKTTGKTTRKTTGKSQQAILNLIATNPNTTIPEMAEALSLTEDGIRYHLKNLQNSEQLTRVGGKKGGYWQILQKND